jgi:molybdenum cofactor cytidylyltransferase
LTTAAVLLAAGGGTRFVGDQHKLLARVGRRHVIEWSVEAMTKATFDEYIVVVGAADVTSLLPTTVTVVSNPNWAQGQASSMAAALDYLDGTAHDVAVFGLADQPGVTSAAWDLVRGSTADLARASYGAVPGHPVRIARVLWSAIERRGDVGARELLRQRSGQVEAIPCDGRPDDIDTVEDLQRWN